MNKTELVAAMAKETNLSKKDVEAVLKSFTDVVADELKKGGKIQLVGFGTFEVKERAAREGRNPQTGETMQIAASKVPSFKVGKISSILPLIKLSCILVSSFAITISIFPNLSNNSASVFSNLCGAS